MTGPARRINGGAPIPSNIIAAIDDPAWWARWFEGGDWNAWRGFLAAVFALPMTAEQLDTYRQCTGRSAPPVAPAREVWAIAGRQGGKTRIAATIAAYLAVFVD